MTDRTGSENRLYPLAERLDEGLLTRAQAVLEDVARRRTAISYSELGDAVPGVGRRGRKIGAVLEVLGRRSLAQHGALITVLVVNKGSGLPSDGFYDLLRDLRPELSGDQTTLARHERERVYRTYPLS